MNCCLSDICENLRACTEILRTSLENDINLNDTCRHKVLDLFLGGKCGIVKPERKTIPKFNFNI